MCTPKRPGSTAWLWLFGKAGRAKSAWFDTGPLTVSGGQWTHLTHLGKEFSSMDPEIMVDLGVDDVPNREADASERLEIERISKED